MRRALWIVGMSLVGFFIGGKAGGGQGAILGWIWGASIGYCFGAIFSQKRPTKRLVLWWAGAIGLIGPFFGVLIEALPRPYVTNAQLVVAGTVGGLVGALLGLAIGVLQLNRTRRRSDALLSGPVA